MESIKKSGVAKGGQVGALAPGAGLGDASTHFFSHLKTRFKQKFRPKYA